MPKTSKKAKRPKRKTAARKSVTRKAASKKKATTRKTTARKKVAPKKKVAAKKKPAAPKKRPAKAKPKPKAKISPPKPAKVVSAKPVAVAPAPKPTKSRLIKANSVTPISETPPTAQPEIAGMTLRVGQPAPDFRLPSHDGSVVWLSDFRGRKVVLFFYPKDDTPGCTKEACAFRDGRTEIEQRGAVVLGISVDPVDSHQMFHEKYDLNFPLLSDAQKQTVSAYGVWVEKSFEGRTWMATERTTFIIDEEGKIARIFPKVQVDGHFEEVLAAL